MASKTRYVVIAHGNRHARGWPEPGSATLTFGPFETRAHAEATVAALAAREYIGSCYIDETTHENFRVVS